MKRNVDLETNINGDPKGFNTAARSATEHARKLERANAQLEDRLKKMNMQMAKSGKSASLMRGEMLSLVAAATALAPTFVAGGAGVVAFGALAVPAIMGVIKAQTEMGDQWASLSTEQKVSASGLRQLIGRYKELAKSVEPDVLQSFNAGLSVAGTLLPRLAPITKAVAKELTAFANEAEEALNSDRADAFFSMLEREAPAAVGALGDALGSGVGAVASLTESLLPLATAGLGVIGMTADLVAALSDLSPELAQAAVLTLALRSPLSSVGDMLGKASGKYNDFATKSTGASKATKLLNVVAAAGPNIYLAAAGAIGFFAFKALTAKSSVDKLVESLVVANRATGNNIGGYEALNRALTAQLEPSTKRAAQAQRELLGEVNASNAQLYQGAQAAQALTEEWVKAAQSDVAQKMANVKAGAAALASQYGITASQAISLADAVGVDLSKGILDNGNITAGTAAKFDRYRQAVEMARNPTAVVAQAWKDAGNAALSMKDRVNALSMAMDAYFNPALAVLQATNQMREALAASDKALSGSKSTLSDRQGALERQLSALGQMASAEFRQTQSVKGASAAMLEQLPTLLRLAGNTSAGRNAVDGLIASMGGSIVRTKNATIVTDQFGNRVKVLPNGKIVKISANTGQANSALSATKSRLDGLQSKTLTITTYFKQIGQQANAAPRTARAAGGPIHGPGTGTSDSIPALLSNGEYVINAKATSRHRGLLEAINTGKFARGGMVRGYASGGMVDAGADVPISEFVSRFMDGKALSKTDYSKIIRSRADAVAQLRAAERKLADDRKRHKSAKTIADDEARVAKERRDLATATEKLSEASDRYNRSKLTPAARLGASLSLGIKNTAAFIKNITTLADRGFGALAQSLLAAGGPDAEAMAASAVKLSSSKLKTLNSQVITAGHNQAKLDALPNILKVKEAQKGGAKSVKDLMARTGLSEEDIAAAFAAMGYARGGIERYARGGRRPGPGIATRPTVLFGEGRAPEGFVPYDPAHRPRAMGLVSKMAADFGMNRAVSPRGMAAMAPAVINVNVSGALDPIGTAREVEKVLRKLVRTNGRTRLAF